jgi:hypothetical protein
MIYAIHRRKTKMKLDFKNQYSKVNKNETLQSFAVRLSLNYTKPSYSDNAWTEDFSKNGANEGMLLPGQWLDLVCSLLQILRMLIWHLCPCPYF